MLHEVLPDVAPGSTLFTWDEGSHGFVIDTFDEFELAWVGAGGQMVRTGVKDIREAGRNTQGVKLINLDETDRLQAIAPVISEAGEEADESAPPE